MLDFAGLAMHITLLLGVFAGTLFHDHGQSIICAAILLPVDCLQMPMLTLRLPERRMKLVDKCVASSPRHMSCYSRT